MLVNLYKTFVFVGEFVHSLNMMGYMIYVDTINIRWYNGIEWEWDGIEWDGSKAVIPYFEWMNTRTSQVLV